MASNQQGFGQPRLLLIEFVGELGFRVLEQHVKPNRDKIQQRVIRYQLGSTSVPRTTPIAIPLSYDRCAARHRSLRIARFGALMH